MDNEGQGSGSPRHESAGNVSPAGSPPSSRTDVSRPNDPPLATPQQTSQHDLPVEPIDLKDRIDDFDWDELEMRFQGKMAECKHVEEEIYKEFNNLLEVFNAWASAVSIHENDRASKRLKTRMSYVQGAESGLEDKRQHYVKVVKAFESALALLSGP
ncbi:MAG: hypothetical protein FRX48_00609 [Lasallia pustulata]|uniref:Uncharacterized protein n=1 Tax=Lasallia pustulata TaxID=136370 RepID=A0A5M8Q399_9LECA|nr:MAG: hypothetical protein FRX48_00609 [Lasallia pustulata]